MQPRTSAIDLHDTQALAHALYCQCQELSGPYQTASKNLRHLHDTLEEISRVFDDLPSPLVFTPFDQAASECSRLLNAIDRALDHDRQPLSNNAKNVKFTARIEVATKKLLNAWEALEPKIGSKDIGNTSARHSMSTFNTQPASITSSELDGATSTMSSSHSYGPTYASGMGRPCLDIRTSGQEGREEAVDKTAAESGTNRSMLLSPAACESWKSPFAFADPMSSDIDTASYLILADDTSTPPSTDTTQRTNEKFPANNDCGDHHTTAPIQLLKASQAALLSSQKPRPASAATKGPPTQQIEIASVRLGPASKQELIASKQSGPPENQRSNTTALYSKSVEALHGEVDPQKPRYRVVNADPLEAEEDSDEPDGVESLPNGQQAMSAPELPEKSSRRTVLRTPLLNADKRMARVFAAEDDEDGGVHLSGASLNSLPGSRSAGLKVRSVKEVPLHISDTVDPAFPNMTAAVIKAWNDGQIDQAELHLRAILRSPSIALDAIKRTRHLLGVAASLNGRWAEALTLFLSVLSSPLANVKHPDAGDRAAAYWMGDIYAQSDRRVEALIAYSVVEQGVANSEQDTTSSRQRLHIRVRGEQRICQDRNDKAYFKTQLDTLVHVASIGDSILNPAILSREAAQKLLDSVQWPPDNANLAESHQSRAMALCGLDTKSSTWQDLHTLQLSPLALSPSAPWPIQYDPLFASANIACGLPLSAKRDLLLFKEIPRTSGALGRSRMNCFTCQDLHWLITTLRACMDKLKLRYTEVASTTGTWLIPQYSSTEGTIASTHYISIAIFRLTFRSGYGLEICPGGIFSSRVVKVEEKGGGGHIHELKRIKKLIRSYMDAALRRKEASEEEGFVVPVMSINGVTSIHRGTSSMSKAQGKRPESASSSPASSSMSGSFFN